MPRERDGSRYYPEGPGWMGMPPRHHPQDPGPDGGGRLPHQNRGERETPSRRPPKGNQEMWLENGRWHKPDLFGYEELAEPVTAAPPAKTNMESLAVPLCDPPYGAAGSLSQNPERPLQHKLSATWGIHSHAVGPLPERRGTGLAAGAKQLPNLLSNVLLRFGSIFTILSLEMQKIM